ncbi:DUF2312 domain-containing protein [Xanthobacter autotrophicus]|uniref:DUF2312 domain-containing protein n=1 Tax=Xanthobacter autotrophicus TaxID=280 RepID=UPI00372C77F9
MAEDVTDAPAGFAKEQLQSFIERIERLEEEKKGIADDIKDVFAEAKANGFDVKALRTILKIRKEDADDRKELEAIVELYLQALGIFA